MVPRLIGLDVARLLALAGMVLVHGWTDLVLLPLEMSGGPIPDGPTGPDWAVTVQSIATDRARPLFVLLAGLGVTLLVARTGAGARVLLLRAAFLASIGLALLLYGWSDAVLVGYGILFVLAVGLVRLPTPVVVGLALAAWSAPVLMALASGAVPDGGPVPVAAEFGYFFLGVALGRLELTRPRLVRRLTATATAVAVVAAAGLLMTDESLAGWQERTSWADLALDTTLTTGALVGVVGACLLVGARAATGPPALRATVRLLATAGTMPLTIYVSHALVYPVLSRHLDADLTTATAVATGFVLAAVVTSNAWARLGAPGRPRRGPIEAVMRRVTGPRSSAPTAAA